MKNFRKSLSKRTNSSLNPLINTGYLFKQKDNSLIKTNINYKYLIKILLIILAIVGYIILMFYSKQ